MENNINYIVTASKNYFKVGELYTGESRVAEIQLSGIASYKVVLDNGKFGIVFDVVEVWYSND